MATFTSKFNLGDKVRAVQHGLDGGQIIDTGKVVEVVFHQDSPASYAVEYGDGDDSVIEYDYAEDELEPAPLTIEEFLALPEAEQNAATWNAILPGGQHITFDKFGGNLLDEDEDGNPIEI